MRRAASAVAALLLVLLLAGPAGAAPPGGTTGSPPVGGPPSSPTGPAKARGPVTIQVATLDPRAPRPGDMLHITGTVSNAGADALHGLTVRVRVGRRLLTRGELWQGAVPLAYPRSSEAQPLPDLAPGGSAALELRTSVDRLRLTDDGVYPLLLEVLGSRGGAREQLGQVPTYLPWFGTTAADPLRLAWVWPVVDRPRLAPSGVLVDDELAGSFAPGGRLGRTLRAARAGEAGTCPAALTPPTTGTGPAPAAGAAAGSCRPVPVTYAVDPDLLATAQTMTRGYQVRLPRGATRPGTGAAGATAWLAALSAAAGTGDVVALPFADPDVVAVTRSGTGLSADVATAQAYGTTVTRAALGREPLDTVVLPPPGPLSDLAFDALTTGSTRAVVLSDDAVAPPPAGARSTPGTRVALPPASTSGSVTGLVVDRGLSDLLVPADPQDARLAEQRWLVETAMVAAELPSRGRTLLVQAPRRGSVDPAVAGAVVADTGAVPWMCPVRLSEVVAARERCPGGALPSYAPERSADLAQPDPRAPGLAPDLVDRVAEVRAAAQQLTGAVLAGGTDGAHQTAARLQRAWLRGESSAWRDDRSAGVRLVGLASDEVAATRERVSVLPGKVLLTSSTGRVTVAVVNELELPVTVSVRLTAPSDARLSRAQTDVLQLPARNTVQVPVDATTLTSGRFVVKAQLLDRDGVPFGAPVDLVVHSTRYGRVALAVTGCGAAVLLAAAAVRVVRRALRRTARP